MDTLRRYDYNLPWRTAVRGAGFAGFLGAAFAFMAWATGSNGWGIAFVSLSVLSATFLLPAFLMLAGRLASPGILELGEDAVLLRTGFIRMRTRNILYADINRMWEHRLRDWTILHIVTAEGGAEILADRLPNTASYYEVRDFIYSHASTLRSHYDKHEPPVEMTWERFPEPILRWKEPADYPRYRTYLVASKPLGPRVVRALVCFSIWILPGFLLLSLLHLPVAIYLMTAIPAAIWLTWVYWMYTHYPARCAEIAFYEDDIVWKSGLQTGYSKYRNISAWAMVERQYEDRAIYFLLLKYSRGVFPWALADFTTQDRVVRLLREKQIPESTNLTPPWE